MYPNFLTNIQNAKSNNNFPKLHEKAGWRRKSKAGIVDAIARGVKIHFALRTCVSPGHFKDIANKTYSADMPQGKANNTYTCITKERAITNAELRFVYRHRKCINIQKNVQFWRPKIDADGDYDYFLTTCKASELSEYQMGQYLNKLENKEAKRLQAEVDLWEKNIKMLEEGFWVLLNTLITNTNHRQD